MGRRKVTPLQQDPSRKWRARVGQLADRTGWYRHELYDIWSQVALAVELDTRIEHRVRVDRSLAERAAFHLLEACVTKQEGEPS